MIIQLFSHQKEPLSYLISVLIENTHFKYSSPMQMEDLNPHLLTSVMFDSLQE